MRLSRHTVFGLRMKLVGPIPKTSCSNRVSGRVLHRQVLLGHLWYVATEWWCTHLEFVHVGQSRIHAVLFDCRYRAWASMRPWCRNVWSSTVSRGVYSCHLHGIHGNSSICYAAVVKAREQLWAASEIVFKGGGQQLNYKALFDCWYVEMSFSMAYLQETFKVQHFSSGFSFSVMKTWDQ